jgi:hypothetical protein
MPKFGNSMPKTMIPNKFGQIRSNKIPAMNIPALTIKSKKQEDNVMHFTEKQEIVEEKKEEEIENKIENEIQPKIDESESIIELTIEEIYKHNTSEKILEKTEANVTPNKKKSAVPRMSLVVQNVINNIKIAKSTKNGWTH